MKTLKRYTIPLVLVAVLLSLPIQQGCGESEVQKNIKKLKSTLNNTAKTLNTIAKSNRTLYEQKIIDIDTRVKAATHIHGANEYLITAINIARTITPETFQGSKAQILTLLNQSLTELRKVNIGKPVIDLAIQTAIGFINTAVAITTAFTSQMLRIAIPELLTLSPDSFVENRRLLEVS